MDWLLLAFGLAIAISLAVRLARRGRGQGAAGGGRGPASFAEVATPERASEAAARLSEGEHQEVYRLLAMDKLVWAAQIIKQATGRSSREALLDAQAMLNHPQIVGGNRGTQAGGASPGALGGGAASQPGTPRSSAPGETPVDPGYAQRGSWEPPRESEIPRTFDAEHLSPRRDKAEEPEADFDATVMRRPGEPFDTGAQPVVPPWGVPTEAPAVQGNDDPWAIPSDWGDKYAQTTGERHIEFSHHDGETMHRFTTEDLPDALRDQLMSQLRDGDTESVAKIIAARMGVDPAAIEDTLRNSPPTADPNATGLIVRLHRGDGTHVEFSTNELEEDERREFSEALTGGDLVTAAQIVSRHTGVSPEQALEMIEAFRRPRD